MQKEYNTTSLIDYINSIDCVKYLTINEFEVDFKVGKYLLNLIRYNTNTKIVEALLA